MIAGATHGHSRKIFQRFGMEETGRCVRRCQENIDCNSQAKICRTYWEDLRQREEFGGAFSDVESECLTAHFMSLK